MKPVVLVLILLSGCLGSSPPPDEVPPSVTDGAGTPALEAADCTLHSFALFSDADRVEPHVPDRFDLSTSEVVAVFNKLFQCDGLRSGNGSMQRDGWFGLTYVEVHAPEDPSGLGYYLLDSYAGWPELTARFGPLGARFVPSDLSVEAGDAGTHAVLSSDGFVYDFQAAPRDPGEVSYPRVTRPLFAGPEGEHVFRYSVHRPTQQQFFSAAVLQADGGLLGDMFGAGTGEYWVAQASVTMTYSQAARRANRGSPASRRRGQL